MNGDGPERPWREILITIAIVFIITGIGCSVAFAIWRQQLGDAQVVVLGSGNQLSLLVTDGPARLVLATGNDQIGYENALTRVRPPFARRIDQLLLAGEGESLLVPVIAASDTHVRSIAAIAALPPSPESDEIGPITALTAPREIRLGPSVTVNIETVLPAGADPAETFPYWRATIEHGQSRVVALSDGDAAALFPPPQRSAVLIVSGADPEKAWAGSPAVALVANAEGTNGDDLRDAFASRDRPPDLGYLVFANEALRLRFVPGGVELPGDKAQVLSATPQPPGA